MAITRTYAVGQDNRVKRLDNHTLPWVDVSVPSFTDERMNILDVQANPNNPDFVVVVGQSNGGNTGIMVSNDAGNSWFKPGGNWEVTKFYYDVWWVNNTTVWVIGNNGFVAKSTDQGTTFNLTTAQVGNGLLAFTSVIHALDDQIAVAAGSETNILTENKVEVFKTIDGGASWTALNGGIPLTVTTPPITVSGPAPSGIWMSDDEQEIIVGTKYIQFKTTNGGFNSGDFVSIGDDMNRSGEHLTWYPSHTTPSHFRHLGGFLKQVNLSSDVGDSWTTVRDSDEIKIRGGHFYDTQLGYFIIDNEVYATSDGALSGTLSDSNPDIGLLNAVWTQQIQPVYCLQNCENDELLIYSDNPLLSSEVGNVIQADITGYENSVCWQVTSYDSQQLPDLEELVNINQSFADCDSCLPEPEVSRCYDLISCNGECPDQLDIISFDFASFVNQLVYINNDTSCIYDVRAKRQAFFINLQTSVLSNPAGDFQLGTDNYTIEVPSLIFNGTQYITGTAPSYYLSSTNYDPLECNGLTCTSVAVNTTENSIGNIPDFLDNLFDSLSIPMGAYSSDPSFCTLDPAVETFKIQYRDGDVFVITLQITNNLGTSTFILSVNVGNVTTNTDVTGGTPISTITCNSDSYCTPVPQIIINEAALWTEECPQPITPDPAQPELGEACDVTVRIGEPGFSFKNCDPNEVLKVKTNFADSVYALFKRMKYGIETCCEFDLDKIDVKNMLIDLGALFDPDLCVDQTPIPEDCCPQPCNAIATLILPLWESCPAPTDVLTTLEILPQVVNCDPPINVLSSIIVPQPDCITFQITIDTGESGLITYLDCDYQLQSIGIIGDKFPISVFACSWYPSNINWSGAPGAITIIPIGPC